jgi:hypothetical protein
MIIRAALLSGTTLVPAKRSRVAVLVLRRELVPVLRRGKPLINPI